MTYRSIALLVGCLAVLSLAPPAMAQVPYLFQPLQNPPPPPPLLGSPNAPAYYKQFVPGAQLVPPPPPPQMVLIQPYRPTTSGYGNGY